VTALSTSFIDHVPKLAAKWPRSKFLCRWLTSGFEFGAVRCPVYLNVSPPRLEYKDALRIWAIGLTFGAVHWRGLVAAKAASQTIPIVFNVGSDPVQMGLVASLSRPGSNATGAAMLHTAVIAKRLELLHELLPAAMSIAFLVNPTNPGFAEPETKEVQEAARLLGLNLLVLKASSPSEIDAVFATLVRQQAGALLVGGDVFFISQIGQLVALAARHAIPAMYAYLEQGAAGGLICYGARLADTQRLVGAYTGRILKGEKPADLPVQQVTKIEMVINMKTARALGLTIPETLLATADEVIQ
jgi:putative tryptophan/tyrosine transport system substrate-binding protein